LGQRVENAVLEILEGIIAARQSKSKIVSFKKN